MAAGARSAPAPLALRDVVGFLSRPDAYLQRPPTVDVRETHLSYVFLLPADVYKMKKPLAHEYGDLRTLDARANNCRVEVALNRRLAPAVYLGVVAVTQAHDGALALNGSGPVVEWLVHMKRLPEAAMLDNLILRGGLRPADVAALAERLGEFFTQQRGVEISISSEQYNAQLRQQLEAGAVLFARPGFGLDGTRCCAVHDALRRYLDDGRDLAARVQAGCIVEGHGDLRPEHVCLVPAPVIIDCLEFSRDLRLLDPFDEIAFLGLECARLGAAWVGPALRRSIEARLRDHPPAHLSAFYTGLRACVRARLALAHLLEPTPQRANEWVPLAREYLAGADRACAELD